MRYALHTLKSLAICTAAILPQSPLPAPPPPAPRPAGGDARAESLLAGGTGGLVFG
ncbi:MAG: superoxide dismutase family protein, partial [Gemmatimonadetes bacterium]|nr:superoxide dismutase family protein [Gemmatimonadota bacterium]